jgi:hypothetical protein
VHTLDELESAMVDLGPACGHRGVAGSRGDRRITRAVVIVGFTVSTLSEAMNEHARNVHGGNEPSGAV